MLTAVKKMLRSEPALAEFKPDRKFDGGDAALMVAHQGHRIVLFDWNALGKKSTALKKLIKKCDSLPTAFLGLSDKPDARFFASLEHAPHADYLVGDFTPAELAWSLANLARVITMREETHAARRALDRSRAHLDELHDIAVALTAERDITTLLDLIVEKGRYLTNADSGSLYIVEEAYDEGGTDIRPAQTPTRRLRFSVSQNDSLDLDFTEFTMPLDKNSLAGFSAATAETLNLEDVYHIPKKLGIGFNKSFDQSFGYRTKSVLVVPMKNRSDEVIGVLQLINCKRDPSVKLNSAEKAEAEVIPFDDASVDLATSLASQAAVSLENALMYEEIQNLFQGFVHASVQAIEARDPTTSGHSSRVAALTVGIAEAVDRLRSGKFKSISFTRDDLQEIEFAGLLHDFGKIGVREHVLVKAKKLYPGDYALLQQRFAYIKKDMEVEYLKQKLEYIQTHGRAESAAQFKAIDAAYDQALADLDRTLRVIDESNMPSLLPEGNFDRLRDIARRTYIDIDGDPRPYLTEEEVINLSLPKGSLNTEERYEIESHVSQTFQYLKTIPWAKKFRNVPVIAYMHHEKLNGTGYPRKVVADEIPLQSRMMTITDIYDALTASDRPYKKAVPRDRALDIISYEVKDGQLDKDLFDVFVDAKVFERTAPKK